MEANKVIASQIKNSSKYVVRIGESIINEAVIDDGHISFFAPIIEFRTSLPGAGDLLTAKQVAKVEECLPPGTVIISDTGDVFQLDRHDKDEAVWRQAGSALAYRSCCDFRESFYKVIYLPGVHS